MVWAVACINRQLKHTAGHCLTLAELCWWSVINGVYEHLPDAVLNDAMGHKPTSKATLYGGKTDTDARYQPDNRQQLAKYAKPVKTLVIDPEPPALFMARPKELTWHSEAYLKFVRSLPCVITSRMENVVAHHLIGHGEGKMGGKAHDLFTIPLTADEHRRFHDDPKAWEAKHGSQLFYVKQTIKKALDLGVVG